MSQLKLTSLFCLFNIHHILIGHLFAGIQQLGTRAPGAQQDTRSFQNLYFILFSIITLVFLYNKVNVIRLNKKLESICVKFRHYLIFI